MFFIFQIRSPACAIFKFKLTVGTGCTKHYACSVTCDPANLLSSMGYRWALLYVGASQLMPLIQVILLLKGIGQRLEQISTLAKKYIH